MSTWNQSFDNLVTAWANRLGRENSNVHEQFMKRLLKNLQEKDAGECAIQLDDECLDISFTSAEVLGQEQRERLVSLVDISEISLMQQRLSHTEKQESVGRLAAGIAHKINTPTQYVISNIDFLTDAFEDLGNTLKQRAKITDEKIEIHRTQPISFKRPLKRRIGIIWKRRYQQH